MGRIHIRAELCKGCMLCARACKRGNIAASASFNALGYRPAEQIAGPDCSGCAACALVCPDASISVWRDVSPDTQDEEDGRA